MAARTSLLLDQPFFGVLALHLAIVEDTAAPTMWTNGQALGYNPAFVDTLTQDELTAVVAHEVMHCAAGHPWRRDNRDGRRFNVACDYAINGVLRDAGFKLPDSALLDSQYDGRWAEWIYDRLPQSPEGEGEGDGTGTGTGTGQPSPQPGEVRDAPSDTSATSETEWQQLTKQAERVAQSQGKLPAGLRRGIDDLTAARVDWRSVLRRFIQELTNADYTWTRPNVRYLASGLYLPSLRSYACGRLVVAVDTSGSVDAVLLSRFGSELQAIVDDVQPSSVDVVYCDAHVQRVDTYGPHDVIALSAVGGGGGTDFRPVFAHVDDDGNPPAALIYLTDMYGTFPTAMPDYPVIWCSSSTVDRAPFGDVVRCQD